MNRRPLFVSVRHTIAAAGVIVALLIAISPSAAQNRATGTIAGNFDVSPTGSANYSIPLRIAPGTAGTEPKLLLTYDSQTSGEAVGPGWSIGGLSTITRGPRSFFFDGRVSGVQLTDDDALYLDGQRLIPISQTGSGSTRRIEYRKRLDDTTRIIQTGADLEASSFIAETKGGLRLVFDGANNSRIKLSDGTTLLLAISRIVDTTGNFIQFYYAQNGFGDYNIITIQYTGNEQRNEKPYAAINFEYDSTVRAIDGYVAGRLIRRKSRLKSITCSISPKRGATPTATASRYTFEYEDRDTANRFVLTTVHQFGEDGTELEPTHFTYSKPQTEWALAGFQLPVDAFAIRENLKRAYRIADFVPSPTGQPALPDLLFAAQVEGKLEGYAYRNDGGIWSPLESFKPPFAFSSEDGSDLGALVVDLNGDGRADLLKSYQHEKDSPERLAFLAGADKWERSDSYQLPFNLSENGKKTKTTYFFVRLSGAAGPDLIFESDGTRKFLKNTGAGWAEDGAHTPPEALTPAARIIDVDCDGKVELALPSTNGGTPHWNIYRYDANGWTLLTDNAFALPYAPNLPLDASRQVNLNADQCLDLIIATAQNGVHAAFTATSTGWVKNDQKSPPFDLIDTNGTPTDASFLDLDSDGRTDVVAGWFNNSGNLSVFAYRQTDTGWEQLQNQWLPVTSIDHNSGAVFADIDGNGRPDLLLPAGYWNGFGRIFAGTSNGFVEKPSFVPPIAFARKDQQDRGVRLIDLNGDGLPDVIFNREITKDGKVQSVAGAFLNTGHGWAPAPGLLPPLPFAAEYIAGTPFQFVDVDSDGYIDLLYSNRRSNGTVTRFYYHNEADADGNRKWVEQPGVGLVPPGDYPFAQEKIGDLGVRFADLNGDGRTDMLVGVLNEDCVFPFNVPQCKLDSSVYKTKAFLNNGTAWVESPAYASPLPFVFQGPNVPSNAALFVELLDVNGDRLADVVGRFKHPFDTKKEISEVWLNTGTGWTASNDIKMPILLDEIRRTPTSSIQWMDLNGDGLTDLIFTQRDGSTNKSITWVSTGRGFVEAPAWQVPIDALADRNADQSFRILDLNGDGYVDLLYSRAVPGGQIERGAYLNNGSGWKPLDLKGLALPPFTSENGSDEGVRLLDVDGNGLPDVLRSFAVADTAVSEQQVFLNQARRSDLLAKIEVGYGLTTNITYHTMLEVDQDSSNSSRSPWPRVYEPGLDHGTYPIIAAVPTSYLVKRVAVEEGNGRSQAFSYHYGDYRVHVSALQPLGFGWREFYNESTGILSRSEYLQDIRLAGRTQREANCLIRSMDEPNIPLSPGLFNQVFASDQNLCPAPPVASPRINILREDISGWKVLEDSQTASSSNGIYQIHLVETQSSAWELDGVRVSKQKTTISYDDDIPNLLDRRQNVLATRAERMDGSAVETTNEYSQDDPNRWFFGRLTRTTTKNIGDLVAPGSAERKSETRTSTFEYDSDTGLLLSETVSGLKKTYTRDDYGNIKTVVLSADNEQDRRSENEYDSLGRFVTTFTKFNDGKPQKTKTEPNPTTGLPRRVKDVNNVVESYTYDGFGRTRSVTSSTNIVTKTEYIALSKLNDTHMYEGVPAAYAIRVTTGKLPSSIRLLDNKARVVRTIEEGFTRDGTSRPIQRDYVYDLQGRNTQTSLPYERGAIVRWITVRFDPLNRTVEKTAPDGSSVITGYVGRTGGGRSVVVTDPLKHKIVKDYNERDLVVSVQDELKGRIRYSYDGGDRVELITGPTEQITRKKYDDLGHPIQIIDPDTGFHSFKYNAFGELIEVLDGIGQNGTDPKTRATIEYDQLGRPTRKVSIDGNFIETTYDDAAHGVGKISKIRIPGKFEKNYFYDSASRLTGIVEIIESEVSTETLKTNRKFDDYGRLLSTSYPAPNNGQLVIENKYDNKGFLYRITGKNGQDPYWDALEIDRAGIVTKELYGNYVTATRSFNPDTGRLEKINVANDGGSTVLDLSMAYDVNGNLKDRREAVGSISEHFEYDALNRLTTYPNGSGSSVQIKYDATGRITSKSGVGTYDYADTVNSSSWQPSNAVLRIRSNSNTNFLYDDNGNLIQSPNKTYKYTADNLLNRIIVDDSHWSHFDYDADGERYRQLTQNGNAFRETIYLGAFERVREFSGDKFVTAKATSIRYRYSLATPNGVFATLQLTATPQAGSTAADNAAISGAVTTSTWYLHRDHIGSIVRITDSHGSLAARFWFDPWGKPTQSQILTPGKAFGSQSERGFTGHEHLAASNLIHMNGRVYDYNSGLFLSADPAGQYLAKYNYAHNNPLQFVDPTGQWDLFGAIVGGVVGFLTGGPGGAIVGAFVGGNDVTRKWLEQNWRTVVIVGATVAVTVATGGTAGPILAGMLAGATSGALSAALYGGSFEDVFEGAIRGAVIGGVTAGAFYGVGSAFSSGTGAVGPGSIAHVAAHGTVGGAMEAIQGGNFWQGFAASAVTKASSNFQLSSIEANTARAAIVGGTVASISGGKFANGAIMGAFAYTFNDALHRENVRRNYTVSVGGSIHASRLFKISAEWGAAFSVNFETGEAGFSFYYTEYSQIEFGVGPPVSGSITGTFGISADPLFVAEGGFWGSADVYGASYTIYSASHQTNANYWASGVGVSFPPGVSAGGGTSYTKPVGQMSQFNIYQPFINIENMLRNHAQAWPLP